MKRVFPLEIIQGMSELDSYVLMLSEPESGTNVPILIGDHEAEIIIMTVEQVKSKRPMTHELLLNILETYSINLKHVVINKFEEGIFYSTLLLFDGFNEKRIDSRTSDAVAMALTIGCPIYIEESVLRDTGVQPNSMIQNLPQNKRNTTESLEELESMLQHCIDNEEYEMAEELMQKIEKIKEGRL